MTTTCARPPVGFDDDVADVAGVAGAPVVGHAVEHEPAPDAGRYHHAEQKLSATARATPPLSQRHAQPVATQPHGRTGQRRHPLDDRKVLPRSDIDWTDCPGRQVDRTG
jgi:hypothetical protein